MPYVKLDCGILDSTVWIDRDRREIFITALLMASPIEYFEPTPQLYIDRNEPTGFEVPAGWYGLVEAAGAGIVRRALVDIGPGMIALAALGDPDPESRSPEFNGRRLIRIPGGYLVLNFIQYRDRDYTMADRARRYRARKLNKAQQGSTEGNIPQQTSHRDVTVSHRDITQSESESESEYRNKNKNQDMSGKPDVDRVFSHWKTIWNHPLAKLDYKRKRTIANALKLGYDAETLCLAIGGYKNSPHHCGQNDRHTVYDDICLLIRDAEHIDAGLRFHVEPFGPPQAAKRKAAITWRPPSDLPQLEKLP